MATDLALRLAPRTVKNRGPLRGRRTSLFSWWDRPDPEDQALQPVRELASEGRQ
jgi:hypothetical protein